MDISLITIIIAIWGAVLSTTHIIYSIISERKKNSPSLKIILSSGQIYQSNKPSEPLILIDAINKGQTKIVLTGHGFITKDKHTLISIPGLKKIGTLGPITLEPHRKYSTYYPCRYFKMLKEKDEIIGYFFNDEEGNQWITKIKKKEIKNFEKENTYDGFPIEDIDPFYK